MAKLFALVYCDNFFVSCEQVFKPSLEGKPVVVLSSRDGWVVARSPEAKVLGIGIGILVAQIEDAIQRYGIVVHVANSTLYHDISGRVMSALQQFCPAIEIHNLDEAWLELAIASEPNSKISNSIEPVITPHNISVGDYVQEIRRKLEQWIGIPISIGIAPTKTLAKVANQLAQASGTGIATLLTKAEQNQALSVTQTSDVWGIGSYYAQQLAAIGILNALQLRDLPEEQVQHLFDPGVMRTIWELQGRVCFSLQPESNPRQEAIIFRTFGEPVETIAALNQVAATYIAVLAQKLHHEDLVATTISITLATDHLNREPQYYNSTQIKLPYPTSAAAALTNHAIAGLETIFMPGLRYQKFGITLSNLLAGNQVEPELWLERSTQQRASRLLQIVDRVKADMGAEWLRFGKMGNLESQLAERSQRYTTEWSELPIAKA